MSSKAASSSSQLKAAVSAKRTRVEEVQANETVEDQKETRHGLDRVKEALTRTEEDRDTRRLIFEDGNKKQGQEIESLRHEYKEQSE